MTAKTLGHCQLSFSKVDNPLCQHSNLYEYQVAIEFPIQSSKSQREKTNRDI